MSRRLGRVALLVALVLVAAGCDWTMFGYGSGNTRYNPTETAIGTANVGSLTTAWTAAVNNASSPVVADGVVYVGSEDGNVYAFDAAGSIGCSGTPRACSPLWSATTRGPVTASPAVVNGIVYVASQDGDLYAFDAAGSTGCSGSPKVCGPLWTASTPGNGFVGSPTVANGVVYVGSGSGVLYAFDAAGSTNCSPTLKTCAPLWTASAGVDIQTSVAVANGVVYVGGGDLYAFDAAGSKGCSGTPKVCAPLWTASIGDADRSEPAVANGVVYINSLTGTLLAFSAAGSAGCSGSPRTCAPLWTAPLGGLTLSSPAVANGIVYVSSGEFARLYAFDAAGSTGCSGSPKTCGALWSESLGGECECTSSPAVANGLVYIGNDPEVGTPPDSMFAFSTSGSAPLWSALPGSEVLSSPAVANGVVYVADRAHLFAFKP